MRFHEQLERLRDAAINGQPGMKGDLVVVNRRDLRELIHHFDRLDEEARAAHAAKHS